MGQNQSTAEVLDAVNEVDSAQKNASPQKVGVCQAETYLDLFSVQSSTYDTAGFLLLAG